MEGEDFLKDHGLQYTRFSHRYFFTTPYRPLLSLKIEFEKIQSQKIKNLEFYSRLLVKLWKKS